MSECAVRIHGYGKCVFIALPRMADKSMAMHRNIGFGV
jgi:hypothetical protein